jgi:hypothetical protein
MEMMLSLMDIVCSLVVQIHIPETVWRSVDHSRRGEAQTMQWGCGLQTLLSDATIGILQYIRWRWVDTRSIIHVLLKVCGERIAPYPGARANYGSYQVLGEPTNLQSKRELLGCQCQSEGKVQLLTQPSNVEETSQ